MHIYTHTQNSDKTLFRVTYMNLNVVQRNL